MAATYFFLHAGVDDAWRQSRDAHAVVFSMQYLGVVVQRGFGGAVDAPARHGVATRARPYIQYAAVGLQGLYGPLKGRLQQDDAGAVKVESRGAGCRAGKEWGRVAVEEQWVM